MMSGEDPASGLTTRRVRKLAALLSADVEGYSLLMGQDEAGTVHTLTVYRAVIQTFVQQHRGRVVDSPGDNLLAEFASVVDAVQCAVAIQHELGVRNTALPVQRRMKFRIGINLGDVIVDGERIYGDGVNIAARLESLAEGGAICIAGSVYEQVKTKLALSYEDLGLQAFKNIAEPVRVYRMREEPQAKIALSSQRTLRPPTSWRLRAMIAAVLIALVGGGVGSWQAVARLLSLSPTKPSIAVLPFVNMNGESEDEYFSDGMTEDLITELSRLDGLSVIARNSAFTYKGKAVKPEQVSRDLGVRYMLEGRVRKANNRVRITVQLVDGTTGYHVWAQSYDRDSNDIFAVQEEIARRITRALEVRLTMAEEKHIGSPYTRSAEAWTEFMRGTERYRRFTPKDNAEARELFEKAIALDQGFARAYANLSATHRQDWVSAWTQNRSDSERLAYENAEKAVDLARREPEPKPSLPYALEQQGFVELYKEHLEAASRAANEVISASPNYADGYALAAHVLIFQGKPEEALQKTQEAINHGDPKYPFFYDYHRGHAHYVWGVQTSAQNLDVAKQHFQEAKTQLKLALDKNKNFRPTHAYLVAVLSELGEQQEAVREMAAYRNLGGSSQGRLLPYKDPAITRRLIQTWQAAERGS
jgi:adenylate cyclase